ncbi:DUF6000 family protein [Antribacter sp. KLBMP9083]|uniref:DUF6000 family protein n=1 Tax=Antribacter soli TaxID=2910976 RepID=A0AA41QHQ1_9MICO|nr:DUF6000 family protein [Antribacter soli]MCF4123693.1 DUF6000 family protein [Antribacter soli]
MITAWVVVMLAVVGVLVVAADAAGLPSLLVLVVALLVGPLSLILPLMRTLTWQVDQVVAHASGKRPESTVIPAAVLTLSRAAGKALGLQTAGLNAWGGSPAAVVVIPDRVELWSGKDEAEPRWSVPRDELLIGVGQVRAGMATYWDHVELSDGRHRVALSPRYSPVPSEAGKDIDRVLAELGQDPVGVRPPDLAERKDSSTIWRRLVKPFYLSMAGAGATAHAPRLQRALVRASVKVTPDQVRWLLAQGWRENAMGAWFALAVPTEEVRDAVVNAMAQAQNDDAALRISVAVRQCPRPNGLSMRSWSCSRSLATSSKRSRPRGCDRAPGEHEQDPARVRCPGSCSGFTAKVRPPRRSVRSRPAC